MSAGLSRLQRCTLQSILALFAHDIERVDVFGSRATGTHRPNSDLDLVLHGPINSTAIDHLWTRFQESNLPFSVDIKNYRDIHYAPLKAHMDRVCKTLFTQQDLKNTTPSTG